MKPLPYTQTPTRGGVDNLLSDVVVIRPLAILLLIVMHSFTIYGGGWDLPDACQPVETYWWIAKVTYSFMLEIFVFISGYLFSYQLRERNKPAPSLGQLVRSKLRRLILPSIVFSALYLPLFTPPEKLSFGSLYKLLDGAGHMWFLPMLFWCFLGGWMLLRWKAGNGGKFAILIGLALLSSVSLPLQLDKACYYLLFFYAGCVVRQHSRALIARFAEPRSIALATAIFVTLFISGTLAIRALSELPAESYLVRKGIGSACRALMLPYASAGIAATYLGVNWWLKEHALPSWLATANRYCFAVYIYHQFLIKALYFHTPLPDTAGTFLLPFVGLALTLTGSCMLALWMGRTRVGRYLLG